MIAHEVAITCKTDGDCRKVTPSSAGPLNEEMPVGPNGTASRLRRRGHHAKLSGTIEPVEGLHAASAIGDDRLQNVSRLCSAESWTHGSPSAHDVFRKGLETATQQRYLHE